MEDAKNKMAGIMKGTNFFRHIALLIAFVFLTTGLTACIQNHKIYATRMINSKGGSRGKISELLICNA